MSAGPDVARVRHENTMRLFDEFVQATVKSPDAATLRGLERRFAERLNIQPSYWSQIKGRSRQVGERLARQFEQLCRKPPGWLDTEQDGPVSAEALQAGERGKALWSAAMAAAPSLPKDDEERFILGLVLTYYRRHPQRARSQLLQLLGEVLEPAAEHAHPTGHAVGRRGAGRTPVPRAHATGAAGAAPELPLQPAVDDQALWLRLQAGVKPLKPRQ